MKEIKNLSSICGGKKVNKLSHINFVDVR